MDILVCPDKFKGTLDANSVTLHLAKGLTMADPGLSVVEMPLADGGEGTAEILAESCKANKKNCQVSDPLGRSLSSHYFIDDQTAFIELAMASGLALLDASERDPLRTSTRGTGELIRDAILSGARRIFLCLGGSATNDGGMGIAETMGARFLDEGGNVLEPCGNNLAKVTSVDLSHLISVPPLTILHDVKNPLLGKEGAAMVYSEQKGAKEQHKQYLEKGMAHFHDVIMAKTGKSFEKIPGMGAAGGTALCPVALFGAELQAGFEEVSGQLDLERSMKAVDVVVTGEGKLDEQSFQGKVVGSVIEMAAKFKKPVFVVCGSTEVLSEQFTILTLEHLAGTIEKAMKEPGILLEEAGALIAKALHSA